MAAQDPLTRFDMPEPMRRFFHDAVARGAGLAWLVVVRTAGSTYSKTGAQMLVDDGGDYVGMLSGGCLEGDLRERALVAIAAAQPLCVSYELDDDDALFGLGVGCDGTLDVLVRPLSASTGFAPLGGLVATLETQGRAPFRVSYHDGRPHDIVPLPTEQEADALMRAPWRVLVLGAGEDAQPLLDFGATLGWRMRVVDHRPAAVDRLDSVALDRVTCLPVAEFAASGLGADCDAAIVMSHNLDHDRSYLAALAATEVGFVGLLGPPHRRDRLLARLGEDALSLRARLRAPVGRPIGGRGAAAIALEVAAELQAYFSSRD